MPLLGIDRRLQAVGDKELRQLWQDVAPFLAAQVDPISGRLPPAYQRHFERLRDEFARRGVQLSLWPDFP